MASNNSFLISADVLISAFSPNKRNKNAAIIILEKGIKNKACIVESDFLEFISVIIQKKYVGDIKTLVEDLQAVYKIIKPSNKAIVGAISVAKNKKKDYNVALLIEMMKENNLSVIYSFGLKPVTGFKVKRA